jgi:hypothetical protein
MRVGVGLDHIFHGNKLGKQEGESADMYIVRGATENWSPDGLQPEPGGEPAPAARQKTSSVLS